MPECDPQDHREKLQAPYRSNFQKGNDHPAWDVAISAATPLHCLAMRLLSDSQNLQNVGHDIVIFNGNVLGHAWHTWCMKGTNGKRMSCSLLVRHMRIFKLIDFRKMGFENGLPFFWYALYIRFCVLVEKNIRWKLNLSNFNSYTKSFTFLCYLYFMH